MKIVIQRVCEAAVQIEDKIVGNISKGMLILVGIEHEDSTEDADWLVQKVLGLRIFGDDDGKMNLSYEDIGGRFLVVSQFTLHASTKKGNRPSYIQAARPEVAIPLYYYFVRQLSNLSSSKVETGEFESEFGE
jgi:D-tyrosyl-tRNA(Tyr) deacylase